MAEIRKFTDQSEFGPRAVILYPVDSIVATTDGTDATRFFAAWGSTFSNGAGPAPRIKVRQLQDPASPNPFLRGVPAILNGSESSDSANQPLVMDLAYPVKRVGLWLAGGDSSTQVEIDAFDKLGTKIGTVSDQGLPGPESFYSKFVGVESLSVSIARLLLSYGSAAQPEEIRTIGLEYVSRPEFRFYLPQVADGPLPPSGARRLRTSFTVSNPSNIPGEASVKFFDQNGQPLQLLNDSGNRVAQLQLTLGGYGNFEFRSNESGNELHQGYAVVTSDVPVLVTGSYRIIDAATGAIQSETAAAASSAMGAATALFSEIRSEDVETGIALVNPSGVDKQATVVLLSQGHWADFQRITLPAHGQRALFIRELFTGLTEDVISGAFDILSDSPVAATVVRTRLGLPVSSLPVSEFR